MNEHDDEPIPGLPGMLPRGEHIIWQGSPQWRKLARSAFHVRLVAAYFGVLIAWAIISGSAFTGIAITFGVAILAMMLLYGLAWLSARSTIYTLTNRRVVMRFGIALPKCVNLPLVAIISADLKLNEDGSGDIPLQLGPASQLGYLQFWPHARPWKLAKPEPMFRDIADAANVAASLSEALRRVLPNPDAQTTSIVRERAQQFEAIAA
jgi:Bacterial PH domain